MDDELIKLDTTIIGIGGLINKASTAEEAKVLFTVKDVIYSQQRYFTDVQPVKHGRWENTNTPNQLRCSKCEVIHFIAQYPHGKINFCPNCGARMDGDIE